MSIHNCDWNIGFEDWDFLNSIQDVDSDLVLMCAAQGAQTFDPREVLKVENQGQQGSCRGHSGSTGVEWLRTLATQKIGVQLSRAMMYYETQRIDGIRGDSGSTIGGGVKLLENVGLCLEELWQYPARYNNARPANYESVIVPAAAENRIGRKERIRSYEQARAWAGTGQGYIDIGIPWRTEYAAPVVERYLGGRILGYHAISLFTLSTRVDSKGRPYLWMLNSHGLNSGSKGWSEYSPAFIEGVLTDPNCVFIGVSDMPYLKPREFTLEDIKKEVKWWNRSKV